MKQTPDQLADFLDANGSSINSLRRQIEGEIAWQRLQRAKIESGVSVGDDEVKAVLDKLNASKGTEEYRVGEIFLSATPDTQAQTLANANKILEQLRNGASFAGYARQYSEASTAAVGGDLGWVRPEQLPAPLADGAPQMAPGTISNPIPVPGGVSIIAVQDTRKILTRRSARRGAQPEAGLDHLPQGHDARAGRADRRPLRRGGAKTSAAAAAPTRSRPISTARSCSSDDVKMRDLPPALQQMMLPMQVGQATQPFGSLEEGVRVLVICGRDEVDSSAPSYDEVYSQLNEERVNIARAALPARPAPRRGDRIPLIAHLR